MAIILFVGGFMGWKLSTLGHSVEKIKKVPLHDAQLRSGDLLLFSFNAGLSSVVTMLATNCPYTHVGLVYEHPRTKHQYIFEVVLEKEFPTNLSLTNLQHRIHTYNGKVLLRSLRYSPECARSGGYEKIRDLMHEAVVEMIRNHHDATYRYTFMLAVSNRKWWHPPMPQEFSSGTLACMDLVAKIYKKMGVFTHDKDDLLPQDFSSQTQNLPMSDDFWLDEEIRIVQNK